MKSRRSLVPAAAVAAVFFLLFATAALPAAAAAAVVEHTFLVSQVKMTHVCKEKLVTVVNGQFPGPAIEVMEGDSVAVHLVNMSPYNITIHWHGVKQRLNCWSDGVPMITQCPIQPGHNFTYRFDVAGQEGTLWWHAHVGCLRATLHGAIIIRPRHGAASYPFPKPHREIPMVIGEWWEMDLVQLEKKLALGDYDYYPVSATINGKLGDHNKCNGTTEDGYVLEVEPGETYLLRIINAALTSEYYLKLAGHKFTVVAADANYVNPYTTDIIAIAPGETVDALLAADAAPGRYYMVGLANEPVINMPVFPESITRATVQYRSSSDDDEDEDEDEDAHQSSGDAPIMEPEMPDKKDMAPSFHFHGNLTGLRRPPVPARVDERLLVTLSTGSVCRRAGEQLCRRTRAESVVVMTMNNASFQLPAAARAPLLEAQYYGAGAGAGVVLRTLPDRPPMAFNFTDRALMPQGPKEERLEPTERATTARRFRHGAVVEVVFQDTAVLQSANNPMHLHGHDMFVLAQGLGNYDAARDVPRYNLADPPVRNTVLVPSLGWAAVRFVADNPGVWFLHCHYHFHLSGGMATVFIVEDGPTVGTALPPPPAHFPKCDHGNSLMEKSDASKDFIE